MYKIEFITSADSRFNTVRAIRTTVFTNEQGAVANEEFDKYDNDADFALVVDDSGKIAGTGRVALTDKGYKIGRIAILKEYRGQHLGDMLVKALVQKALTKGAKTVFVDSQLHAVAFYEKIGFAICGEQIVDRGLPHIPMMYSE